MINAVARAAYRIAHWCRRALPRRRRSRQTPVVAVWCNERLLVVKHSYQDGWFLPGGAARRDETLEQGAARELREETGIEIDVDALTSVYTTAEVCIFEYCPCEEPRVRIDHREIVDARFVDPRVWPELAGYVTSYLLSRT